MTGPEPLDLGDVASSILSPIDPAAYVERYEDCDDGVDSIRDDEDHCDGRECVDPDGDCAHCGCCTCNSCFYARVA